MRKIETIQHFYCNECGNECDGKNEIVSLSGYTMPYGNRVEQYVTFGRSDEHDGKDYCLCDECKRKALEAALQNLNKTHGKDLAREALQILERRLKECNSDVDSVAYRTNMDDMVNRIDVVHKSTGRSTHIKVYPFLQCQLKNYIEHIVSDYEILWKEKEEKEERK